MIPQLPFTELLTALGIGLLIGLERGWKDRADPDGSRVAGFRTIGLIGFLGGLMALVDPGNGLFISAGFIGVALLLRQGFKAQTETSSDVSITTTIAALAAFGLGALAVRGDPQIAAAGAVLAAFVLWLRQPLHGFLNQIDEAELSAFLRLLLISLVVLPVLPDAAYGPYSAFNPRSIWWMVVLISSLGFAGYVGVKWLGQRRGIGLLSLAGGLASSTAVTLSLARFARTDPAAGRALAAGVALAWSVMLVRTMMIIGVLAPRLLAPLALPFGLMLAVALLVSSLACIDRGDFAARKLILPNPLDLRSAMAFAALLAVSLLLSKWAVATFGSAGLFSIALLAGSVDIDAISISLADLSATSLAPTLAAQAITLAAISNTALKIAISSLIGGGTFARRCAFNGVAIMLAGGLGLLAGQVLNPLWAARVQALARIDSSMLTGLPT